MQIFAFCIFLCTYKHELVHSMYVPSIYILWTSSKQVCTQTCMSCMYLHTCLYNVCTMYILVWTWFIPVHPVSYHEPAISFSVRSISLMNAIRTRLNTLCNRYRQCYGTGICLSVYTLHESVCTDGQIPVP
jgi:hypothetical protein